MHNSHNTNTTDKIGRQTSRLTITNFSIYYSTGLQLNALSKRGRPAVCKHPKYTNAHLVLSPYCKIIWDIFFNKNRKLKTVSPNKYHH